MKKDGLLTQAERTMFEALLNDENFKGKKQLKHLLWLNTTKPKYRAGECFKVTDEGHSLCGVRVVDFNAKVLRAFSERDVNEWRYELEIAYKYGGKDYTSFSFKYESELRAKAENNVNIIENGKRIG